MFLISAPFLQDFNPRSREGSDRVAISSFVYLLYFNPRSREGSDKNGHMYGDIGFLISIHAPAKGATIFDRFFINAILFQSTLPRRERPFILPEFCYFLYFNPRSREGSDECVASHNSSRILFQSTLPRRERPFTITSNPSTSPISIHAPAKGATRAFALLPGFLGFQSTLPRRERPECYGNCNVCKNFNPRSREGSDRLRFFIFLNSLDFNPRSREGSDIRLLPI